MKTILKNYKTTVPAVLGIVAVALYWLEYINNEQLLTGVTILTSAGLFAAKDAMTKPKKDVEVD